MIPPAIVERRQPVRKTGTFTPTHFQRERVKLTDNGDPFNARNIVHDGDFYMEGKPFPDPGVHLNIYTAIPFLQSIMEKRFGLLTKLRYRKAITTPRGKQHAIGNDVNIDTPEAVTWGSFATYTGQTLERVRSGQYGY